MVVIRLSPAGKRGDNVYKIMVADKDSPLTGRYLEKLGIYTPKADKDAITLNADRLNYWISKGAQPSPRMKTVFKKNGITWVPVLTPKAPKAAKVAKPASVDKAKAPVAAAVKAAPAAASAEKAAAPKKAAAPAAAAKKKTAKK